MILGYIGQWILAHGQGSYYDWKVFERCHLGASPNEGAVFYITSVFYMLVSLKHWTNIRNVCHIYTIF